MNLIKQFIKKIFKSKQEIKESDKRIQLILDGKIPANKLELFKLISSWGKGPIYNIDADGMQNVFMHYESNECYDLSNIDVSQITDLSHMFCGSYYNGDLSKWNVSNCTNMNGIFKNSQFNNNSISNWNISNVLDMTDPLSGFNFSGDISKWRFNKNVSCNNILFANKSFKNKYNNGKTIPYTTKEFLNWFEDNKINIGNINISKEEELNIDNYLNNYLY